jgi:dienelactone hydrolase
MFRDLERAAVILRWIGLAAALIPGVLLAQSRGSVELADYGRENVAIRTQAVPQAERWKRATDHWGLGEIAPLIPAFDGRGLLMASWTPSQDPHAPTFVIAHGGGGIGGMLLVMGANLRATTNANILLLDSIWSRGRTSNGGDSVPRSGRTLSANVRMFDLAAAGRWLAAQGADPTKTYVIGESQGGWGVLRAFTDDPTITGLIRPHYAGGVALYPQCDRLEPQTFVYHRLGPYHSRVMVITGGLDTLTPASYCAKTTLESAEKWLHWDDVTHAFNISTHGLFRPPVDGVCQTLTNSVGTHQFCHNERRTQEMLQEVRRFARVSRD